MKEPSAHMIPRGTATLALGDKTYSLPVFEGSEREAAIDISSLRKQSGAITLD